MYKMFYSRRRNSSWSLLVTVFITSSLLTLYMVTIQDIEDTNRLITNSEILNGITYNQIDNDNTSIGSLNSVVINKMEFNNSLLTYDKSKLHDNFKYNPREKRLLMQASTLIQFRNGSSLKIINHDYYANIIKHPKSDGIMDQLELTYQMGSDSTIMRPLKTIYLKSTFDEAPTGSTVFQNCPVQECVLSRTSQPSTLIQGDAIMFGSTIMEPYPYYLRPQTQIWIYFNLESPINNRLFINKSLSNAFNWTASYRRDSTIVTPYEKFMLFDNNDNNSMSMTSQLESRDYAKDKSDKVAWFVSNCDDSTGRMSYAKHLSDYISVHVYGNCGTRKCPREHERHCFDKLKKQYKFYLAFENSNCRDYITEKFFRNALMNDVIPIVMGAPKEDYENVAPPHSFIHVDDFKSPRDLAYYLHKLDRNDHLYNQYFEWKTKGKFINTKFFCRLCAMLHMVTSHHVTSQINLTSFWEKEQCIRPKKWVSWKSIYKQIDSKQH